MPKAKGADAAITSTARTVIKSIWYRARINAFAHKVASHKNRRYATFLFIGEVVSALLGILFVITVGMISTADTVVFIKSHKEVLILGTTFLSVIFAVVALFLSVIANYLKFDTTAAEHKALLGLYQYIAQRAREVNWPDMPASKVLALLEDLERDFQLMKAKGTEPDDADFDAAHKIFHKIRSTPETKVGQSFDVSSEIALAESPVRPVVGMVVQKPKKKADAKPGDDMLGAS